MFLFFFFFFLISLGLLLHVSIFVVFVSNLLLCVSIIDDLSGLDWCFPVFVDVALFF